MKTSELHNLKKGDLLIYEPNGTRIPILECDSKSFTTIYNGRTITRAMGQLWKVRSRYIKFSQGDKIERDFVFYCPVKNKMVELKAGSIYLGEV